jgi:fucose 4-O-acetylase-like acetyltransferase
MAAIERNQTIDIVRGAAMLLVVYGHSLEVFSSGFGPAAYEAHRMIYSFHMPAFYFVSGMAARNIKSDNLRKTLSSALALVIMADITHLIVAPLYAARSHFEGLPANLIAQRVFYPILAGYGFILVLNWFLVSLAFGKVLAWIYLRGGSFLKVSIWIASIFIYLFADRFEFRFFEIQTWTVAFAFILLGNEAIRFDSFLRAISRRSRFALMLITCAGFFYSYRLNGGCPFNPLRTCNVDTQYREFGVEVIYGHLGFIPLFILSALLGIAMLVFFALTIEKSPVAAAIAWIGRNTLALMILNGFARAFILPLLVWFFPAFSSLLWSAGISVVQIAVLPFAIPVVKYIQDQSCRIADLLLASMTNWKD